MIRRSTTYVAGLVAVGAACRDAPAPTSASVVAAAQPPAAAIAPRGAPAPAPSTTAPVVGPTVDLSVAAEAWLHQGEPLPRTSQACPALALVRGQDLPQTKTRLVWCRAPKGVTFDQAVDFTHEVVIPIHGATGPVALVDGAAYLAAHDARVTVVNLPRSYACSRCSGIELPHDHRELVSSPPPAFALRVPRSARLVLVEPPPCPPCTQP